MPTEHIPVTRVSAKANEERTAIVLTIETNGPPQSFSIHIGHAEHLTRDLENARTLCVTKAGTRPPRGHRAVVGHQRTENDA